VIESSHSHAVFLSEVLIVHLKICGSQTNFQQSNGGFNLQDRWLHQCVVLMELISDELMGILVKRLITWKLTITTELWRFTDLKNCVKWSELFMKVSSSPTQRTRYIIKKTSQGVQKGNKWGSLLVLDASLVSEFWEGNVDMEACCDI
jgi:hypothetical protein